MLNSFDVIQAWFASASGLGKAGAILALSFFVAIVIIPFVDGVIAILTRKTKTDIDDKIRAVVRKPMFYAVLYSGMAVAVSYLPISAAIVWTVSALFKTAIVIVLGRGITSVARVLLNSAVESKRIESVNTQTEPLFGNVVMGVMLALEVYALFLVWGIDVTAWLASAGILGIAVGFAAKDTLSNLISGAFILADKPYKIGDYISLGSGTVGIVESVGLRSTRIRTFNDEEVTIPNGVIAGAEVVNKSAGPKTGRVNVSVGVAYGSDVNEVADTLMALAREHKEVLDDPEPVVRFTAFGDSSLDFVLSCRVADPLDGARVQSELNFMVYERFGHKNIEIPFPQRDVTIKNNN